MEVPPGELYTPPADSPVGMTVPGRHTHWIDRSLWSSPYHVPQARDDFGCDLVETDRLRDFRVCSSGAGAAMTDPGHGDWCPLD